MGLVRMLQLGALVLLGTAGGCQRQPTALTPVNGKVLYKGALLPSGLIVFTPDAGRGASGASAFSTIRADGSYTLYTGDAEGASAGWYRISVAALTPPSTGLDPLVPEKYRDPGLSLLSCEVKADRANHLDFNLD